MCDFAREFWLCVYSIVYMGKGFLHGKCTTCQFHFIRERNPSTTRVSRSNGATESAGERADI